MTLALADVWAPVLSGLVASVVTLLGAFGLESYRRRKDGMSDRAAALHEAVTMLLTGSMLLVLLGSALRLTMQVRSGLVEGLEVTRGARRPVEPLELHDRMVASLTPIFDSQAMVWTRGDPELILKTNDLVNRCTDLVGEATTEGTGRGVGATALLGMRWSADQDDTLFGLVERVGHAREQLAAVARAQAGLGDATLLGEPADS